MEEKKKTTTAKVIRNKDEYIYAKGGRKTAVAQVRLFLGGKGEITVNGLDYKIYFPTLVMQNNLTSPLALSNREKTVNLSLKVSGSGKSSQSEAARHAISRALEKVDKELRPALKAQGFLTRDPRVKERKKPGLKRARRAPQWSKR